MRNFLYKITGYDSFKEMTTSKKFDFLFWTLWQLVFCLFFLVVALSFNKIRADEIPTTGTYQSINSFFNLPSGCYRLFNDVGHSDEYVAVRMDRSQINVSSIPTFSYNLSGSYPYVLYSYSLGSGYNLSDFVEYIYGSPKKYTSLTYPDDTSTLTFISSSVADGRIDLTGHLFSGDYYSWYCFLVYQPGGVQPEIDYSPVRKVYPTYSVDDVSSFSYYVKRNYNVFPLNLLNDRMESKNLVLYFTRYIKDSDALISYYLLFVPDGDYWFNFNFDELGNIVIDFNSSVKTKRGLTSIYSISSNIFNTFSETNFLTEVSNYNNYNNWKTYSVVYSDWDKFKIVGSIFDFNSITDSIYSKTYLDLDIPKSLTLFKLDTGVLNHHVSDSENVIFYRSVVETSSYYDYYFLMNLYDGSDSSVKDIYNYGNYLTNSSNNRFLARQYYTSMEFLNVSYIDYGETLSGDSSLGGGTIADPEDFINTYDPSKAPGLSDEITRPTEDEYDNATLSRVFSSIMDDFTNYLNSESNELSTLIAIMTERRVYFTSAININNVGFLSASDWISNQIDYVYNNTSFSVLFDLFLASSVVFSIIF